MCLFLLFKHPLTSYLSLFNKNETALYYILLSINSRSDCLATEYIEPSLFFRLTLTRTEVDISICLPAIENIFNYDFFNPYLSYYGDW